MTSSRSWPVPPSILASAMRYFRVDLSPVRWRIGDEPALRGAIAYARGLEIVVDPALPDHERDASDPIWAHELTHVVQQLEGRACACVDANGGSGTWAMQLEYEAWAAARSIVEGASPRRTRPRSAPRPVAVVQCAVAVDGRKLASATDLPERVRLALEFVDGGRAWLDQAIADPAVDLAFASDERLVRGIQDGLHGQPLALLRELDLRVSPVRLLDLSESDLRQLLASEGRDDHEPTDATAVRHLMVRHGLHSVGDLDACRSWLDRAGIREPWCRAGASFGEAVALAEATLRKSARAAHDEHRRKSAARHAAASATSLGEFADVFAARLALHDVLAAPGDGHMGDASRERVQRQAGSFLDALLPHARAMSVSPRLPEVPSSVELYAFLHRWVERGRSLGFARTTAGLRLLCASQSGKAVRANDVAPALERVRRAHALVGAHEPTESAWTQDGTERRYRIEHRGEEAVVAVDSGGTVTLQSYRSAGDPAS